MSIDKNLVKFNVEAYRNLQKEIDTIQDQISFYRLQKNSLYRLAILFFASAATVAAKALLNQARGAPLRASLTSPFSLMIGLIGTVSAGGSLWCLFNGNNRARQITQMISDIHRLTRGKFYGELLEEKEDPETKSEVLKKIQENLKQPVRSSYVVVATHEITLEGDKAENFSCTSRKVADNFQEVQDSIGAWRSYYIKRYETEPTLRASPSMRVIASQCIQGISSMNVEDGLSLYTCSPPTAAEPKSGRISLKIGKQEAEQTFTTVAQFNKYLDSLPKVRVIGTIPTFKDE